MTLPDQARIPQEPKRTGPPSPLRPLPLVYPPRGEAVTAYTLTKLAQDENVHPGIFPQWERSFSLSSGGQAGLMRWAAGGNMVFTAPQSWTISGPPNPWSSIPPCGRGSMIGSRGSIQHPLARNIGQVIGVNAGLFNWVARCRHSIGKTKGLPLVCRCESLKTLENRRAA